MKRIDGVESVDVSLNEGTATLGLKRGNHVTVQQVRDVVRKNGFTPKATGVRVAGTVVDRNGKPALAVRGLELVLLLAGEQAALVTERTGRVIELRGTLPEEEPRNAPQTLVVSEVRESSSQ
jgi:hypothetical protein